MAQPSSDWTPTSTARLMLSDWTPTWHSSCTGTEHYKQRPRIVPSQFQQMLSETQYNTPLERLPCWESRATLGPGSQKVLTAILMSCHSHATLYAKRQSLWISRLKRCFTDTHFLKEKAPSILLMRTPLNMGILYDVESVRRLGLCFHIPTQCFVLEFVQSADSFRGSHQCEGSRGVWPRCQ